MISRLLFVSSMLPYRAEVAVLRTSFAMRCMSVELRTPNHSQKCIVTVDAADLMPQLLLYGRDHALLDTRRLVLQSAGFAVHATAALHEVQAQLSVKAAYGLLIVCHTASAEDRRTLAALAEHAVIPVYQIDGFVTPDTLIKQATMPR